MEDWKLQYYRWRPQEESLREVLCTLGNGYFATRGAGEESIADGIHYPGTYLAGGYNRLKSDISGRIIENEDLVNFPNWLSLTFRTESNTSWFKLEDTDILEYRQELDIKHGVLQREIRFKDQTGRETLLTSRRLVSRDNPHLAAIQWIITPQDWSGSMTIRTGLDGSVTNQGVARYRALNSKHLIISEKGKLSEDCIYLLSQTNQSRLYLALATQCRIYMGDIPLAVERETIEEEEAIYQEISFSVQQHDPVRIEKMVSLFTSKDHGISEPVVAAQQALFCVPSFDCLLENHSKAWSRIWHRFDMHIDAPDNSQLLLRLHIFHLLQVCSEHSISRDAGVPARGWHGEAYRGHIFWDELFIFPLLNFHMPALTKSLLLYRYDRLPAACHAARESGFCGAMYPWQSGSDGREESQILHLNPLSKKWVPDHTWRQRHVNAAIAFNTWQYFVATNDCSFMRFYGAAIILEIARFFSSIAVYNSERDKFEIKAVVGPDEFHTAYPESDEPGIHNNAYTNFMVVWVLIHAEKVVNLFSDYRKKELLDKLGISDEELDRWRMVSQKMFIPMNEEGIIDQFEGYHQLEELDLKKYQIKYASTKRLDRILDAEGDSINRYKISKQADVLMLFYLFSPEELAYFFNHMGYSFEEGKIQKNIDHYMKYTSDGSSLSHIVRTWVTARSDRYYAWRTLREALHGDFQHAAESTTSEGIHLASMAGTVDILQRCFTGIDIYNDILWFDPFLPEQVRSLNFRFRYRGHWLVIDFNHHEFNILVENGRSEKIKIGFKKKVYEIYLGQKKTFSM